MSTEAPPAVGDAWPAGHERIVLDTVDSTMAEARRRAPALRGPAWIMARRQSAAHGRRGRSWASPEGNFAATMLMRPEGNAGQAALRSFTAAVALAEVLGTHVAPDRVTLKWPNDVLLDGGKVAGILLESAGRGVGVDWLAVGIGVNLRAAPVAVEPGALPPVSLAGQGGPVLAPETVLDALAARMATWEHRLAAEGFAPVRRAWLSRAARLGAPITARLPREEITGIFEDVDSAGRLVLRTDAGPRAIAAADVFF